MAASGGKQLARGKKRLGGQGLGMCEGDGGDEGMGGGECAEGRD